MDVVSWWNVCYHPDMFVFREGLAYFKQAYVKPQQCGKGLVTERGLSAVQT